MKTPIPKTMPNPPKNTRDYYIADDFRDGTLLDALADVFTPPEDLTPPPTNYWFPARVRYGKRMREYFRVAIAAEEERQRRAASDSD